MVVSKSYIFQFLGLSAQTVKKYYLTEIFYKKYLSELMTLKEFNDKKNFYGQEAQVLKQAFEAEYNIVIP